MVFTRLSNSIKHQQNPIFSSSQGLIIFLSPQHLLPNNVYLYKKKNQFFIYLTSCYEIKAVSTLPQSHYFHKEQNGLKSCLNTMYPWPPNPHTNSIHQTIGLVTSRTRPQRLSISNKLRLSGHCTGLIDRRWSNWSASNRLHIPVCYSLDSRSGTGWDVTE